jgi:hypothetical protein
MILYRFGSCNSRKVRSRAGLWMAATIIIFSWASPRLSAAAQEEASAKGPRVGLAELDGTPGASLMMPFYFTPDPKTPMQSLAVDIEYVSNNLKFEKSALGIASEQGKADVQTSVTDGQPDAKGIVRSTLHVKASLSGENAKQGLPDGLLAYLLFQISMDAKPFSIRLVPKVVSAEDTSTPPKNITDVATDPGIVKVQVLDVAPEATCFFFTH